MPSDRIPRHDDWQDQIDALSQRVADHRVDIDALRARADKSDARTDAVEARAAVDREMIGELQSDGVLSQQHAAQMEEALRSSRTIGAALGIIMASRDVDEDEAFLLLRASSQHSNRKLREIAAELVAARRLPLEPVTG